MCVCHQSPARGRGRFSPAGTFRPRSFRVWAPEAVYSPDAHGWCGAREHRALPLYHRRRTDASRQRCVTNQPASRELGVKGGGSPDSTKADSRRGVSASPGHDGCRRHRATPHKQHGEATCPVYKHSQNSGKRFTNLIPPSCARDLTSRAFAPRPGDDRQPHRGAGSPQKHVKREHIGIRPQEACPGTLASSSRPRVQRRLSSARPARPCCANPCRAWHLGHRVCRFQCMSCRGARGGGALARCTRPSSRPAMSIQWAPRPPGRGLHTPMQAQMARAARRGAAALLCAAVAAVAALSRPAAALTGAMPKTLHPAACSGALCPFGRHAAASQSAEEAQVQPPPPLPACKRRMHSPWQHPSRLTHQRNPRPTQALGGT